MGGARLDNDSVVVLVHITLSTDVSVRIVLNRRSSWHSGNKFQINCLGGSWLSTSP